MENARPATRDDIPRMAKELRALGYPNVKFRWDAEDRIIAVGSGREGVRAPGGGPAAVDIWIQAAVCHLTRTESVH
jgi:hypothetical protein